MNIKERFPVTLELLAELRAHKKRTRVGPVALLRGLRKELPDGITSSLISRLLKGDAKTIRTDHLAFLREHWEAIPDWLDIYQPLTKEMRQALRAQKTRTRVGEYRLLKDRDDQPEGLTYQKVTSWLHQSGIKHVKKIEYAYVFKLWSALPSYKLQPISRTARGELRPGRVFLQPAHISALEEYKCQGVSWSEVAKCHPEITPNMISSWLGGRVVQVGEDHLGFVLKRCKELTYKPTRRIVLGDDVIKELRNLDKQLQLSRKRLIEGVSPPEGFETALISAWLNGYTHSARKDYVDFVLTRYRELLDSS